MENKYFCLVNYIMKLSLQKLFLIYFFYVYGIIRKILRLEVFENALLKSLF